MGTIRRVSEKSRDLIGYEGKELINHHLNKILPSGIIDHHDQKLWDYIEGKKTEFKKLIYEIIILNKQQFLVTMNMRIRADVDILQDDFGVSAHIEMSRT